jgi:hypothetical protein
MKVKEGREALNRIHHETEVGRDVLRKAYCDAEKAFLDSLPSLGEIEAWAETRGLKVIANGDDHYSLEVVVKCLASSYSDKFREECALLMEEENEPKGGESNAS